MFEPNIWKSDVISFPLCGMSLYSWYNYSLFDPIDNIFITPYYQSCWLMLFYLGWDTYHMITKPILFRTDLMMHHALASFTYITFSHICSLQMGNILIMECISLVNYSIIPLSTSFESFLILTIGEKWFKRCGNGLPNVSTQSILA